MKISTKGRYGLLFLLEVVSHQHEGPVTLNDVALRQNISQLYLWQVVTPLKAAGILHVKRGTRGGYVLACDPAKITMREIVDVLEESFSFAHSPAGVVDHQNPISIVAQETWGEIDDQITSILSTITLKDLVNRLHDAESKRTPDYVI